MTPAEQNKLNEAIELIGSITLHQCPNLGRSWHDCGCDACRACIALDILDGLLDSDLPERPRARNRLRRAMNLEEK